MPTLIFSAKEEPIHRNLRKYPSTASFSGCLLDQYRLKMSLVDSQQSKTQKKFNKVDQEASEEALDYKLAAICKLFDFIFYVPINIFSVMSGLVFLGWTSTKQRIKCLADWNNSVPLVRLEPATPQSQVKHSTTESPRSLQLVIKKSVSELADLICSLEHLWHFHCQQFVIKMLFHSLTFNHPLSQVFDCQSSSTNMQISDPAMQELSFLLS